jgi:hypothetical protein
MARKDKTVSLKRIDIFKVARGIARRLDAPEEQGAIESLIAWAKFGQSEHRRQDETAQLERLFALPDPRSIGPA